jgi:hypothetical protein
MLSLLFLWLNFSADAQLRPTHVLLEESAAFNVSLYGGYDGVGGGDLVDVRKLTAWFYGEKQIKTCFHVTQSFGLSSQRVESLVIRASEEWKSFFTENNINSYYQTPINTNLSISPTCVGGEDLVLFFGTGPIFGNLNDMKARQLLVRPIAYVNKTHMSQDLMWSKGYIRFVEPYLYLNNNGNLYPDWTNENKTYHMILHELGHVFGFLHRGNSVMSSNIAIELFVLERNNTFNTTKDVLFPKPENKSYTVNTNTDALWSSVTKVELKQNPTEIYVDSSKAELIHEMTDTSFPLIANIHQTEPVSFTQTRLVFFKFQDRNFTLEVKSSSIEVRENGSLLFNASEEEN